MIVCLVKEVQERVENSLDVKIVAIKQQQNGKPKIKNNKRNTRIVV